MALDIFIMTDQPETCRQCGTRTDFIDSPNVMQLHQCGNCQFTYWLEDGTITCIKCGSKDVLEDIFDDTPSVICKSCRAVFHRDDEIMLDNVDPRIYFGE